MASDTLPTKPEADESTSASAFGLEAEVREILKPLASLKFTVALFALAIFIVLAGTFAQTKMGNWQAVDTYFRTFIAWVEVDVFFPKSFFPDKEGEVPGVLPFPGGWTIGLLMFVNLAAAHGLRFKTQAKGSRLWGGVCVILLGVFTTYLVIVSGDSATGMQARLTDAQTTWLWRGLVGGLVALFGGCLYGLVQTDFRRKLEWWTLAFAGAAVGGVLTWIVVQGEAAMLGGSSMRILWQLIQATFAGLVLLAGCIMVFRKRAGIVLLHAGVGLLMFSELLVGLYAEEGQMHLYEGETSNYVMDIREVELAVVDESDPKVNRHAAVPESRLRSGEEVQDEELPFRVKTLEFFENSKLRKLEPDEEPQATKGAGADRRGGRYTVEPLKPSTGMEDNVDNAAAYVQLTSKDGADDLGTWLVSQELNPQTVEVAGKEYELELRFARRYLPYSIHLKDVRKDDYIGTSTPRDYSSFIRLVDEETGADREIRVWMNNPLRYRGATFYQSNYIGKDKGRKPVVDPETGKPVIDPMTGRPKRVPSEATVLQVVTNEGWMIPYVACMIVATGMLAQFLLTLQRFLNRRARSQAATGVAAAMQDDGASGEGEQVLVAADASLARPQNWPGVALLAGVLAVAALFIAGRAKPPSHPTGEYDFYAFGKLPVVDEGRVKPMDTLARNNLQIITDRQYFKDANDNTQPAARWLLDVVSGSPLAEEHEVFRIANMDLQGLLELPRRKRYRYALAEFAPRSDELIEVARRAGEKETEDLDVFQKKTLELFKDLRRYRSLRNAFQGPPDADAKSDRQLAYVLAISRADPTGIPFAVPSTGGEKPWEPYYLAAGRVWIQRQAEAEGVETTRELAKRLVERAQQDGGYERFEKRLLGERVQQRMIELAADRLQTENPRLSPEQARMSAARGLSQLPDEALEAFERVTRRQMMATMPELKAEVERGFTQEVTTALGVVLGETAPTDEPNPAAVALGQVFDAWRENDPAAFNAAVAEYRSQLPELTPEEYQPGKVAFETYFNHFAPFFWTQWLYLFAFVLAALGWLFTGFGRELNRTSFWLIVFSLVVHTFALLGRMYVSGRPPVTNLYSSAVFIGWGCVVLGIVLELLYRVGIGNVVAGMTGFMSLGVAHLLSLDGDTFTVMQAVLDTQFWLATHVVCITLGYSTTFLAGFLGVLYVVRGVLTPSLSPRLGKDLARMIYGTLCFAIFFSFVGTVLGGLWADDSWGRFWGWDPKENGALIIVLWNALVLHARWDGMVKDRGLAVLAVAGNVATAWSWFGTNELGVGLHSYGFTEGRLQMLALFVLGNLALIGLGCLSKKYWLSVRRHDAV